LFVADSQSNDVYMLRGVGHGLFDDSDPVIYQTGLNPVQLFVGQFTSTSSLDLVTINQGSNNLTVFTDFGAGHSVTVSSNGMIAAVAGDFAHNGWTDLVVASAGGQFTLVLGGTGGPEVASTLATGLTDLSDLALGAITGNTVELYATVDGIDAAIP